MREPNEKVGRVDLFAEGEEELEGVVLDPIQARGAGGGCLADDGCDVGGGGERGDCLYYISVRGQPGQGGEDRQADRHPRAPHERH